MGITVRELITKLTISGDAGSKLAKFGLAVNGVKAGLDILVGTVKLVSRASLGLVNDVTKVGDAIDKTARSVGLNTKEFQRLTFAAERTGTPMTNLVKGLQNIDRNIRDATIAARGNKNTSFTGALEEIGLRLKDLSNLNAEERIGLIGEALSQVADQGQRVALSQKLVGEEAGPKFASLLAEGRTGLAALGDQAEEFGLIMDKDAIKASIAFQDSLTDLKAVITGVKRAVGVALIPQLKKGVDSFKSFLLVNREIIKQRMESVVRTLSKAFSFLLENSDRIFELFESGVQIIRSLVEFFLDLTEAVGGLERLIKLAAVAWGVYALAQAAALGPVGLMAVALIGVAAAFFDIETAAERAKIAQDKFNKSQNEDVKLNREQARIDAVSVSQRLLRGKDVSNVLRRQLVTGSAEQAALVLQETGDVLRGIITEGGRKRVAGKSGILAVRKPNKDAIQALRFLKDLSIDISEQRAFEERATRREAADIEAVLDPFGVGGVDIGTGRGATFRPPRPPGGAAGKADKKSLSDLLADAIKSGELPESAALLASTQPPIIIPITNNNITMDVDAPVTVTGVPGEDAVSISERVVAEVQEIWQSTLRDAMDQLRPRTSR